jgi:hypothetical protein
MSQLIRYVKKKIDLIELFTLYRKQPWLLQKDENLAELFKICASKKHKALLINLLEEFHFLDGDTLSNCLNSIYDNNINQ